MNVENNITVVGIGKLGLGFALLAENSGYNVLGVDIFQDYVDSLNNKTFKSDEPSYDELIKQNKNFRATTSLEEGINFSDMIYILVQTPNSGGDKFYDHTILSNLLIKINKIKTSKKHIIIGCTVMPTYIDTIATSLIDDCTISYNPEFVAQGEIVEGFLKPDIILIGSLNDEVISFLAKLYMKMTKNGPEFCVVSPLDAEIVKISLNGFITTKLSFANMISDLCDTLGADKEKVLKSIGSDSRIGNKYFRHGYSFGGPCFPRDTRALKQLIDQNGINSDLLSGTTTYNEKHVEFMAEQLLKENKEEYVIKNVCYKDGTNISIIEESAKLKIAKYLVTKGKNVIIQDKESVIQNVKKEFGNLFKYQTI